MRKEAVFTLLLFRQPRLSDLKFLVEMGAKSREGGRQPWQSIRPSEYLIMIDMSGERHLQMARAHHWGETLFPLEATRE